MKTKILSVFPACGKTWIYEHQKELGISVLDSDSSEFSWMYRKRTPEEIEELKEYWEQNFKNFMTWEKYANMIKDDEIRVRNPEFPDNYIEYIKDQLEFDKYDYIFVSSHESVRKALNEEGIDFIIVFPKRKLKNEWINRCYLRENNGFPLSVLVDNWDKWIDQMYLEIRSGHRYKILKSNQYLSDVLSNYKQNKLLLKRILKL